MGGIEDDELCELIDNIMLEDKYRAYSVKEKLELRQDIFNSIKRLDILQSLIEDDSVTEIMINGSLPRSVIGNEILKQGLLSIDYGKRKVKSF